MTEAERTLFRKIAKLFSTGEPGLTYHMSKNHPGMIRENRLLSCNTNESLSLSHLEAASAPWSFSSDRGKCLKVASSEALASR